MSDDSQAKSENKNSEPSIVSNEYKRTDIEEKISDCHNNSANSCNSKQWNFIFTAASALFTAVIAVATVVNVCIANRQWTALVDSNSLNKKAVTSVQRAFISIDGLKRENVIESDGEQSKEFTPVITNNGANPAINVTIAYVSPGDFAFVRPYDISISKFNFLNSKLRAPFDPDDISIIPEEKGVFVIDRITIGPKSTISAEIMSQKLRPETDRMVGPFFYGSVHYDDIFGVQHVTKYCFSIDNYKLGPGVTILQNYCTHWNCTDEFCLQDRKSYDDEMKDALKTENP